MSTDETEKAMGAAVENLRDRLMGVRGADVTPGVLAAVKLQRGGRRVRLESVATLSAGHNEVVATLNDPKDRELAGQVQKAIAEAGFPASLHSAGVVKVSAAFPAPDVVVRLVRAAGEQAKVAIRAAREAARRKGEVPDKELQRLTDRHSAEVDAVVKAKCRLAEGKP